jgi:hypothetical protein
MNIKAAMKRCRTKPAEADHAARVAACCRAAGWSAGDAERIGRRAERDEWLTGAFRPGEFFVSRVEVVREPTLF